MELPTRERLISTTARLLQRRGFHGASLNEILRESGAPRGSLYFHFPGGKAQLAAEATRAEVDQATRLLEAAFTGDDGPAEGVRASFEAMADYLQGSDFTLGCPIAPLVLDVASDAPDLAEIARDGFAAWHAILRQAFERAGIGNRRAAGLATLVLAAEEGAILLARARRDVTPLREAAEELARVVSAEVTAARGAAKGRRGSPRPKGGS